MRTLSAVVMVIMLVHIGACGFILYPERKGQTSGRIDPGVAILDAILIIPGVFPGVIAFAVDFVTGCIYLPGGSFSMDTIKDGKAPEHLEQASQQLNLDVLDHLLSDTIGKPIHVSPGQVTVLRVNDPEFIHRNFVKTQQKSVSPNRG